MRPFLHCLAALLLVCAFSGCLFGKKKARPGTRIYEGDAPGTRMIEGRAETAGGALHTY